ncbi:effector-associated domain 2-containing protein [Streptomyces sp. URMC 124]|uniref:effector-associated domain 2-containing protein n=1 Tax=Streptomyces sp. URMC 124 TaxID=3423405 RepID=UPI003F1C43FE
MGPHRGQVRVLSPAGGVWGAGFLVAPGIAGEDAGRSSGSASLHVMTCAHVVTDLVGGPSRELAVDFPGRNWSASARPLPDGWSPPPPLGRTPGGPAPSGDPPPDADAGAGADLAILALAPGHPRLPRDCGPLRLAPCGRPDGRTVSVIGYPHHAPAGLIATARLTGGGGPCPDWLQLDALRTTGAVVEHGFSGAAVWDPDRARVIGIITAAHTDRAVKAAWMLPVEAAVHLWPPLAGAVSRRPGSPHRCTPPPPEQRYELAEALLDVPEIGYDSGRSLRAGLPPPLRRAVREHAFPRQQLEAVVRACMDHEEGCPALRAAVRNLAGGSLSARYAMDVLDRICCAQARQTPRIADEEGTGDCA